MKTRFPLALLVLAVLAATVPGALRSAAAAPDPCQPPHCVDVSVPVPPSVHVTGNTVRLLLPPGYAHSRARYPVVYLLCGAKGNQTEWTEESDVAAFTARMKAIFVMPDCGGAVGKPGWYSNWKDGSYQWETYYTKTVPRWVNRHLRTIKHDAAIVGLSMGGYGALALAARHPKMYRTVAAFSGVDDNQYGAPATSGIFPSGLWGNPLTDAANWKAHNPTALAAKLRGKTLYLSSGTGGPQSVPSVSSLGRLPTTTSAEAEEDYMYQTYLSFTDALHSDHIPYHADTYLGGSHSWWFFQAAAHWALPGIVASLHR